MAVNVARGARTASSRRARPAVRLAVRCDSWSTSGVWRSAGCRPIVGADMVSSSGWVTQWVCSRGTQQVRPTSQGCRGGHNQEAACIMEQHSTALSAAQSQRDGHQISMPLANAMRQTPLCLGREPGLGGLRAKRELEPPMTCLHSSACTVDTPTRHRMRLDRACEVGQRFGDSSAAQSSEDRRAVDQPPGR
jgi:hypothetical protein